MICANARILGGGDARESLAVFVVLPVQRRVFGTQPPVVRGQARCAYRRLEPAAHAVDNHRCGQLQVRAHRGYGDGERRRPTGARKVELEKREESGHDDRPDYRE